MRKFKVTKKWPGGPEYWCMLRQIKDNSGDWISCNEDINTRSYFGRISELSDFVEELTEENRFDKAKRFPKMTYRVNAEGDVCLADFTNTDSPRAEFYANREQAEARAQLNAHIQKMGRIDKGDKYFRLVASGEWVNEEMTREPYELFADSTLPSFANDEDKAERVRLFNAVYDTNF